MRCPGCGQKVPQGQICTNCNSITYAVRRPEGPAASLCPKCGEALEDGDAFCSQCGEPVARAAARPAWKVLLIGFGLAAILLGGSFGIILLKARRKKATQPAPASQTSENLNRTAPNVGQPAVDASLEAPLAVTSPLGPFGNRGFFLRPPRGTEASVDPSRLGVIFGDPQEHGLVVSIPPAGKANPKGYHITIYAFYVRSQWVTGEPLLRYRSERAEQIAKSFRDVTISEGYSQANFDAEYSPGTPIRYEYKSAYTHDGIYIWFERFERVADGLYCLDVLVTSPRDPLDRRPIPPTAADAFQRLPAQTRRDVETVLRNLAVGEAADRALARFPASTAPPSSVLSPSDKAAPK